MQIYLSNQAIPTYYSKTALFSIEQNKLTIHVKEKENRLSTIQKAARRIESEKYPAIELAGDHWDLESCWAFWLGFRSPKNHDHSKIKWVKLNAKAQKEFNLRLATIDWVREIINSPSDQITPKELAQKAATLIQAQSPSRSKLVSVQFISGEALKEQGLIGTYTVGKGSVNAPVFAEIDFNPTKDPNTPIFASLVGKGITFDSGGYSLKPSTFMETMRSDMGGAALLTGAFAYAIAKGLKQRVKLYLCCAENMVSNNAFKLGDIIHYPNQVSVEVLNTDAEGRLVLADGLIKASQDKPQYIIDCATLTGAAKIAVGNDYHSLFSFDNAMIVQFNQSAAQTKEPFWRLPLAECHRSQIPSSFADITNTGLPNTAGASTAAAFLSHFVENYQSNWLHIDCSATFMKGATACWAKGATGIGVLTLAHFLCNENNVNLSAEKA